MLISIDVVFEEELFYMADTNLKSKYARLKLKCAGFQSRYNKLKSKVETSKMPFQLFFAPLMILYLEMVLKICCFGDVSGLSFFFTCTFSLAAGFFISAVCSLFTKKINTILFTIFLSGISAIFLIQMVYYKVFKTFTTLFSTTAGIGRILEFWREILTAIGSSIVPLIFILLPLVVWFLFVRYTVSGKKNLRSIIVSTGVSFFLFIGTVIVVSVSFRGNISPSYLYKNAFIADLSAKQFGMLTMLRLDIKNLVFGMNEPLVFDLVDENLLEIPEINKVSDERDRGIKTNSLEKEHSLTEISEVGESETELEAPSKIADEYQILNIDFDRLMEESSNDTLRTMHEYFKNITPTKQNEYTGMFEGKNLVWFCAEGFSSLALDPECTPTLYQLANEGFVFENFYNPIWGVSTSDGEYATCTGLIPKSGVWSFYKSGNNSMPFAMGTQLRTQGYATNAYHNNTYNYYNRDISHPNMGYQYTAIGNGLEMEEKWPRSDLEMIEKTVPTYIDEDKFHTYYMTISGHLDYNFDGNAMSYKHKEKVENLPYSEGPRAYIACNIELELAVKYLIDELSRKGILDDTVIVLSGDHYPYGLTSEQMSEIAGHEIETEFEMYKSTLILWNSAMEETVYVEKVCSPIDILPTLSNLFGLEYDSRLLIGRDILSESQGLVMFQNRSWITDYARYNASAGLFTPNEEEQIPENYQETVTSQVKIKFELSTRILDMDYYKIVFHE